MNMAGFSPVSKARYPATSCYAATNFARNESEPASAKFAAAIVAAKANNQRSVLQRALRDHGDWVRTLT